MQIAVPVMMTDEDLKYFDEKYRKLKGIMDSFMQDESILKVELAVLVTQLFQDVHKNMKIDDYIHVVKKHPGWKEQLEKVGVHFPDKNQMDYFG